MKTAKEMFEELGYKQDIYVNYVIIYRNGVKCIRFDLDLMALEVYRNFHYNNSDEITFKELQAINKQVEELGWNE